jgi:hypothetical protein
VNDEQKSRFWMVWTPAGRPPVFRHTSYGSAEREARRLAGENSGMEFFVLASEVSFTSGMIFQTYRFEETPF